MTKSQCRYRWNEALASWIIAMTKVKESTVQSLYLRRAERVAHLVAAVPFVRLVGLTGSLARGRATGDSDIDYLIIVEAGHLYTSRWLITLLVQLLGLRRYRSLVAGRICLNHYQTTGQLTVTPHNQDHAQDLAHLVPLVDTGHIATQFLAANPPIQAIRDRIMTHPTFKRSSRLRRLVRLVQRGGEMILSGRLGTWLEPKLKRWQLNKIQANQVTRQFPERIKVSDTQLLFHPRGPVQSVPIVG